RAADAGDDIAFVQDLGEGHGAGVAPASSSGAYRAVFFAAAASRSSAGWRPIGWWPAGSCGGAVAAWGAGGPAWAGDAWLPVSGWSPLLVVMAGSPGGGAGCAAGGVGLDDELGQSSRRCSGQWL